MAKTKALNTEEKKERNFREQLAQEMLRLATSGFGLVAALAWNEVIKEAVEQYIKPLVGGASGLISLVIYAIIVTVLAVTVTYQLSHITKKKS